MAFRSSWSKVQMAKDDITLVHLISSARAERVQMK